MVKAWHDDLCCCYWGTGAKQYGALAFNALFIKEKSSQTVHSMDDKIFLKRGDLVMIKRLGPSGAEKLYELNEENTPSSCSNWKICMCAST